MGFGLGLVELQNERDGERDRLTDREGGKEWAGDGDDGDGERAGWRQRDATHGESPHLDSTIRRHRRLQISRDLPPLQAHIRLNFECSILDLQGRKTWALQGRAQTH